MSLKETAAKAAAAKYGKPPSEAGAFLDDLVETPQKPVQPANAATGQRPLQAPKPVGERVAKAGRRVDIRTLNATERQIQFSTRIDADLDRWIGEICVRRKGRLRRVQRYGLADFLEDAARALDKEDGVSRDG